MTSLQDAYRAAVVCLPQADRIDISEIDSYGAVWDGDEPKHRKLFTISVGFAGQTIMEHGDTAAEAIEKAQKAIGEKLAATRRLLERYDQASELRQRVAQERESDLLL